VNIGVKSLFRRSRPVVEVPRPLPLRIPLTSSFPSGHATSAFCAATLLADGDPHLAPLYYGAATIVALSRIHVQIHHASDVAGGVAIGLILGQIGKRIAPLEWGTAPVG
jgi:membrane-associated phospholipid phosphatase